MLKFSAVLSFACTMALLLRDAPAQWLDVGYAPGSNETVTVNSGTYLGASVGIFGIGTLINNGAIIGALGMGEGDMGNGTYIQNGPSASIISTDPRAVMEIGAMYGNGHVIQNGGTVSYAGTISLSFHDDCQ